MGRQVKNNSLFDKIQNIYVQYKSKICSDPKLSYKNILTACGIKFVFRLWAIQKLSNSYFYVICLHSTFLRKPLFPGGKIGRC